MITHDALTRLFTPQGLRRAATLTATTAALLGCVLASHSPARAQRLQIPDVLVTAVQPNGREEQVRFYSDLVRGKKVVINVMYTSCTTTCPTSARVLAREMQRLGGQLGRDVDFISISVDPEFDNPGQLRSWAARFGARPGWTFITGSQSELATLLRPLRLAPNRVMHSPYLLLVNDPRGVSKYTYAFTPNLRTLIENILDL
jgi:cytochrome oxidase Cu insertion factor (SCO1/SenC/PrrC family)